MLRSPDSANKSRIAISNLLGPSKYWIVTVVPNVQAALKANEYRDWIFSETSLAIDDLRFAALFCFLPKKATCRIPFQTQR
jgi:hypothetical protein